MHRYRGFIGFATMLTAEGPLLSGNRFVAQWFTPIAWVGYILLMDHVNHRLSGWSLMGDRTREFLLMIPLSIACWVIFEAYNLHLKNWTYVELPANPWVRHFGYLISFATIFPGIFQTYYFVEHIGLFRGWKAGRPIRLGKYARGLSVTGALFLVIPLLTQEEAAKYLFGLVWVGFILVLEPINYRLGFRSILGDMEKGDRASLAGLLTAGAICGVLWEFWNFWAETKWVYTLPFPVSFRIFEMPALGFLGFLPFAIECYCMFTFCAMRDEDFS